MSAFRLASRVTLTLGLGWFGLVACGSTDGDLFGTGNEVDANAGDGGGPDDGSGGSGDSAGGVDTGGNTGELSCPELAKELAKELEAIQSCDSDEECGQPLEGTSCGCTRNLVARKDADTGRFDELLGEQGKRCDGGSSSTCDCPAADGFECSSNRCGWNYQSQGSGSCTEAAPGQLCVKSDGFGLGASLEVGEKLEIEIQPVGCFSSSCTRAETSACSIQADGDDFVTQAEFCLSDVKSQGGGCTGDCANEFGAQCHSEIALSEGEHTVTFGDLSLTFTVPGEIPQDALCIGKRF